MLGSKPGRWLRSPDCSWDAEIPPPRGGGGADPTALGRGGRLILRWGCKDNIQTSHPAVTDFLLLFFFLPLLLGVKYLGRLLQVSHWS